MKARQTFGLLAILLIGVLSTGCARQKTTDELVADARAADESQRLKAIHTLSLPGQEADVVIPVFTDALRDENYFVRRDAARALRRFGADARPAVPALLAAARDREASVRRAATLALQEIDPAAARKILRR